MSSSEMMEVRFSIHGPIAGRVLRLNTSVKLPKTANLEQLLEVVGLQNGIDILTLLRKGSERPVILRNGEYLELPAAFVQPLQDTDEVVILQAIAGG